MKFTQGDPALLLKAEQASILFFGLAGRGATAPGAVVVREVGGHHPFATHFFNAQDGGYHSGNYFTDRDEAFADARERRDRYDPSGELGRAFRMSGPEAPTYTVQLRQRYTNEVLDTKSGDDIGDLLREFADEGCISGGDTLVIIDNEEEA